MLECDGIIRGFIQIRATMRTIPNQKHIFFLVFWIVLVRDAEYSSKMDLDTVETVL